MKKILAIVIGAILACGAVFADDDPSLTFTGSILTGARVEMDAETGNTAQLLSEEFNVPGVGAAFRLNGEYDAGDYGANVQFKFMDGYASYTSDLPAAFIGHAYGWLKLLDGAATLKAGFVEETAFDTVGDQGIYFFDGGSLGLTWSPVEGLLFGVRAALEPAMLTGGTPASLDSLSGGLSFGISYSNDALTVQAAITGGDWYTDDAEYDVSAAYAQFGVTAVENLTLEADSLFIDLMDFPASGSILASELVGYQFGKIGAEVLCGQTVVMGTDASTEFSFEPAISYAVVDAIVPYVGSEIGVADNETSLAGKLGVRVSVSDAAFIHAYYMVSNVDADHAIQIDISWYF